MNRYWRHFEKVVTGIVTIESLESYERLKLLDEKCAILYISYAVLTLKRSQNTPEHAKVMEDQREYVQKEIIPAIQQMSFGESQTIVDEMLSKWERAFSLSNIQQAN